MERQSKELSLASQNPLLYETKLTLHKKIAILSAN